MTIERQIRDIQIELSEARRNAARVESDKQQAAANCRWDLCRSLAGDLAGLEAKIETLKWILRDVFGVTPWPVASDPGEWSREWKSKSSSGAA